jgi:hypothetical protein
MLGRTINAAAVQSDKVKILTSTIETATLTEEAANEQLQKSTPIQGSSSILNAASGESAPPTKATTRSGVGNIPLPHSQILATATMATAATPKAATDPVPVADQGDAVEVDDDVSQSIDEAENKSADVCTHEVLA